MDMELMEIRECEIRSVDEETRMVSGIAVPYGQTTQVNGYKERVEKGAFGSPQNVTLFYGHDHRSGGLPIGKVVEARDTDEGLEIKAQISKTAKGEEVYTLLREGVLNKFSIGFQPTKSRRENGVLVREKGDLKEVSVVAIPAYANAVVSEVRDADNLNTKENEVMTETVNNAPEVAEIREAVSDLERKFAVLSEQGNTSTSGAQFRSGAEMLKALAAGDDAAKMEIRAYTGATLADADGDARPGWVNRQLRLVDENRNFLNLFAKAALPASGNSVEYAQVTGTAGTVGVQANEGDDLPYMEVALGTATAPVLTYGGYSSLSRQAIERSDMAYLETVLRYQTLQYAKATNKAVLGAFNAAVSGFNNATLAADDAESWIGLVIDSAALIEDNGQGATAGFIVVARDVFRRMVTMTDNAGRPLLNVNGDGQNTFGSVNVRSTTANLAGYTVIVDNNLPAGSAYVGSSEAVTVFESPGAPFRLQDENIINLTKDFSLYGYMAVAVTNPLAVVRVDADLVA